MSLRVIPVSIRVDAPDDFADEDVMDALRWRLDVPGATDGSYRSGFEQVDVEAAHLIGGRQTAWTRDVERAYQRVVGEADEEQTNLGVVAVCDAVEQAGGASRYAYADFPLRFIVAAVVKALS